MPEYYTSRRCPKCKRTGKEVSDFVGYVGMRRAHCIRCGTWFHRDLLAASNMAVATKYYLDHLSRPAYLLPIDKDGKFVFLPKYGPNLPRDVPTNMIVNHGDRHDIANESSSSAPPPPGKTILLVFAACDLQRLSFLGRTTQTHKTISYPQGPD